MPNIQYTITANSAQGKQALKDFNAEQKNVSAGADKIQGSFVKSRNAAQEFTQKLKAIKFPQELLTQFTRLQATIHANGEEIKKFGDQMHSAGGKLKSFGGDLAPISLAAAALSGVVLKVGSDFESSFAGVIKTVNGTETQLASLRQGIRDMAQEIPLSTTELNGIAEAAGQLGIKTENILDFTRTMADLGVTTNLSSTEAASSLARLSNIMGTNQSDFDRMGSTIVALGNNFATTEAEIVAMAMRLAGAGKQIGLTEAEVFGFATALSSLGVEAEAGGSAISRVFVEVEKSIALGNDKLAIFADIAGQSVEDFSAAFKEDAAGTMTEFIKKLGEVQDSGGSVSVLLTDLGLDGIRVADSLKRAANSGDLLNNALALGADAWEDNTALAKEAEQRYATFESQIKILWNSLKDVAITLFDSIRPILTEIIIPALKDLVDILASVSGAFTQLPQSAQLAVMAFVGLVAIASPLIILIGTLISSLGTITAAFGTAAASGTIFGTVLTGIAAAAGPVVAVIGTALAGYALGRFIGSIDIAGNSVDEWVQKLFNWGESIPSVKQDTEDLAGITEKLATVLEEKCNVSIEQGRMTIEEWNDAVVKAAIESGLMGESLNASQEEMEKLRKSMEDALNPGADLEKQLFALKGEFSEEQIIQKYGAEILSTVDKYKQLQQEIPENIFYFAKLVEQEKQNEQAAKEHAEALRKIQEQLEKWNKEMRAALDPGHDLEQQLAYLRDEFNDYQIISIYGDKIEEVYGKYRELGLQVPKNIQDLIKLKTETQLAAAANANLEISFADLFPEINETELSIDDFIGKIELLSGVAVPGIITETNKIPDALKNSFSDAKDATKDFADAFDRQVSTVVTNFAQAVGDMIWEWESFGDALKDVAKKFISSIISLFVEQLFKPLIEGISGIFSGSGFSLGGFSFAGLASLFGGGGGSSAASFAASGAAGPAVTLAGAGSVGSGTAGTVSMGQTIAGIAASAGAIILMSWLNSLPLQAGGTLPTGTVYPVTIEGTDIATGFGAGGGIASSFGPYGTTNPAGGTVDIWTLEGMGITPEDVGIWGYSSWNDYYQSVIAVTESNEAVADAIDENVDAIERQSTALDGAALKARELADATKYTAKTFEDLDDSTRSMFDLAKTTGIVSTQLMGLLGEAGLASTVLEANALTAKNMSEASEQFATLANGLNDLLPSLNLGISDFLTSGVITDAFRQYVESLGGDIGVFEAYAGLFENLPEGQEIADYIAGNAEAQQIVADAMAEAAGLSITAEQRMQEAVDAFDTAVNNFADTIYWYQMHQSTVDSAGRRSSISTATSDSIIARTELTKPTETGSSATGTSDRNFQLNLNVNIDSPVTVTHQGQGGGGFQKDADEIAARVGDAIKFNNKGIADRIADSTSRILKSRGDI